MTGCGEPGKRNASRRYLPPLKGASPFWSEVQTLVPGLISSFSATVFA
jgi:hypothetical protein